MLTSQDKSRSHEQLKKRLMHLLQENKKSCSFTRLIFNISITLRFNSYEHTTI